MNTIKKILSLTLIVALALVLSLPALAAEVTIVADPGETGTEAGETYTAYKILDAAPLGETAEAPGTFTSVAYSISKSSPFHDVIAAFGGETPVFTLYSKDATSDVVALAEGVTSFDAAELATALKAVVDDEANADAVAALSTSFTGNKATLSDGYFLITSSLGSKMIVDTFGMSLTW